MTDYSKRQRRYTIARPESALALLTEKDQVPLEDDHQFDRIADILSNLIHEANQAVSIPMVRKLSNSAYTSNKKKSTKRPASRSSSTPIPSLSSSTCMTTTRKEHVAQKINTAPVLLESFKRLDSSMAVVDSLSRDLIVPTTTTAKIQKKKRRLTFDSRLSALILIPLFHVPHVLMSMVFDTVSNYDNISSLAAENSGSLSGMLIWAFIFAVTNVIMIDNNAAVPASSTQPLKLIPGASNVKRKGRNSKSSKRQCTNFQQNKRTTVRMMHAFCPFPTLNTRLVDGHYISKAATTVRARRNSF